MKLVNWNLEKAKLIKETRNIDFEQIAVMIEENNIIQIEKSPNRPNQNIFVLEYDNYIICVPFVETEQEIFIKTAFRSRKLEKRSQRTRGEI